jgi:hypothetical protein
MTKNMTTQLAWMYKIPAHLLPPRDVHSLKESVLILVLTKEYIAQFYLWKMLIEYDFR